MAHLCRAHALGGMVGVVGGRRRARLHCKHAFIECMFLWEWLMSESGGVGSPAPYERDGGAGLLLVWLLMSM